MHCCEVLLFNVDFVFFLIFPPLYIYIFVLLQFLLLYIHHDLYGEYSPCIAIIHDALLVNVDFIFFLIICFLLVFLRVFLLQFLLL